MIAFNNVADGGFVASGNLTFSQICTGSNRALLLWFFASNLLTSATYGGVSLAVINTQASANYGVMGAWGLLNPPPGTNNIVANAGGGPFTAIAISYTGVKQIGLPDATAKQDPLTPTSPIITNITTVANYSWIVAGTFTGAGTTFTAGSNQTIRSAASTNYSRAVGDTNGAQTPAGSKSMGSVFTGVPGDVAMLLVSLAPASEGALFYSQM